MVERKVQHWLDNGWGEPTLDAVRGISPLIDWFMGAEIRQATIGRPSPLDIHGSSEANRRRIHVTSSLAVARGGMNLDLCSIPIEQTEPLSVRTPEEQFIYNLYRGLYDRLMDNRGKGHHIGSLALHFMRPFSWGIDSHLPEGIKIGKDASGNLALIDTSSDSQISLATALDSPNYHWGVNLGQLSSEEVMQLLNGDYCDKQCQYYHGNVGWLKTLGEFIAPVDAKLFGEHILDSYVKWRTDRYERRERKFRVLIPAQADETTIGGILDYLEKRGLTAADIKKSFHFELADLCVTPLVKVRAELKRKNMSELAEIASSDVFTWPDRVWRGGKGFHLICADHFIDLFPPEGPFGQRQLLIAMVRSLAPDGKIVLTTRCGLQTNPLSREKLLYQFAQKVGFHVLGLAKKIGRTTPEDYFDDAARERVLQYINTLFTLLYYRQLRDVYPFQTTEDLKKVLRSLNERFAVRSEISRLEEDKVKFVMTRSKS
jgi:hypothetical protein